MKNIFFEVLDYEIGKVFWKEMLLLFLKKDETFEIRHWRDDESTVNKALSYGIISTEQSTEYEISVTGNLNENNVARFKEMKIPYNEEEITEFFTINIGKSFSSSHYGKEIYLSNISDELYIKVMNLIEPFKEGLSYLENT